MNESYISPKWWNPTSIDPVTDNEVETKFSLLIDESNSIMCTKSLHIPVKFFCEDSTDLYLSTKVVLTELLVPYTLLSLMMTFCGSTYIADNVWFS